jgi:NAD(P)-dependent dehydrogenase (short-subunit alcohol dehydrogenase family)
MLGAARPMSDRCLTCHCITYERGSDGEEGARGSKDMARLRESLAEGIRFGRAYLGKLIPDCGEKNLSTSPDKPRTQTEGGIMPRLEGKVAVISGGDSGIGLAIAQRFVNEGAHAFIFGRHQEALDEAAQSIDANVTAIQADATRLEDLDRVADAVRRAKGKVDVVVSSAGLTEQVPLPKITPDHYDRTFALNAKAPLFLVQKMLPMMGSGGSIILVSSAMHYMGLPNHSTYAATKAALRSYSRTWAAEFKDSGIRANTLSPGITDTPILDSQATTPGQAAAIREGYTSITPMLRLAQPEEIANAALFLASDESSFMTGSDMVVDGGVSNI